MKLVSIDIETTGLNPETDQILEFAAVCFDPQPEIAKDGKVNESGRRWHQFECLVKHDRYSGDAYALGLNADILNELAGRKKTYRITMTTSELVHEFRKWLDQQGFNKDNKGTILGKNYASFDGQFLRRIPGWTGLPLHHHRVLDPGSLLFNPSDGRVRNLKECLERIGIRKDISHRAIDDARDTATVVSRFFA